MMYSENKFWQASNLSILAFKLTKMKQKLVRTIMYNQATLWLSAT